MMLAIHNSPHGFHPRWVSFCQEQGISYKIVDCYANDLISQLHECSALLWHHSQGNPKDILIAKQIIFALEHTGFKVFPNFRTAWYFDDKLGQKYLLEAINAPLVPTFTFFKKEEAMEWAASTTFPKVFKLRGGAGSANVRLAKTRHEAEKLIRQAFGRGFSNYAAWPNLQERWRKFRLGKTTLWDVVKGVVRFVYPPQFARVGGRERGYVYFQEFIPGNDHDIRIITIHGKAFGLKRMVRQNDFRASGSGDFKYAREEFDERCVRIAFDLSRKLGGQCVAYDFVFDADNQPLIVEISYGFVAPVYDPCPGYWDEELHWHEGRFNPQAWMIESLQVVNAKA